MLPQDGSMSSRGYPRPGPACPCIHKPLPCLVDGWMPATNSVHFEQQLTIETSSEYSLDRRMFPGWDPESGEGQSEPALLIASMPPPSVSVTPVQPKPQRLEASPGTILHHPAAAPAGHHRLPAAGQLAAPAHHHHHRHPVVAAAAPPGPLHAALPTSAAWTPAGCTAKPPASACACHPAFRPATLPDYHMAAHRHYQQRIQHQHQQQQRQQHQQAIAALTAIDTDFMALLDSLDAEPAGYALDVDWLIGKPQPPAALSHVVSTAPRLLHRDCHQQQQQQQRVCDKITSWAHTFSSTAVVAGETGDVDYQRQFYPGATGAGGAPCCPERPQAVRVSRPVKRRLSTDIENLYEGAVTAITAAGPLAKRARWGGVYGADLRLNHIPSPLQARAY